MSQNKIGKHDVHWADVAAEAAKYVEPPLSVFLAQWERRNAAKIAYERRWAAQFTTTGQVQLSGSIDADPQFSRNATESQILESHQDPSENPPHILGSLEPICPPEEGRSSCDHTKLDDVTGVSDRHPGPPAPARRRFKAPRIPLRETLNNPPPSSSHVFQEIYYNEVPLACPKPQRHSAFDHRSGLSKYVQQLQDISTTPTKTGRRSHTPLSSVGAFTTAPKHPRQPEGIRSTMAKSGEGTCRMTSTIEPSLGSQPWSGMPSLLPSHIQDLQPEYRPSIPGSFPFDDERQRDTTSQATFRAPTTSVNDASQTLPQTDHRRRGVDTYPSERQPLKPSTQSKRGPLRRQRKDDSWRREA